jgi:hypothetical protein
VQWVEGGSSPSEISYRFYWGTVFILYYLRILSVLANCCTFIPRFKNEPPEDEFVDECLKMIMTMSRFHDVLGIQLFV